MVAIPLDDEGNEDDNALVSPFESLASGSREAPVAPRDEDPGGQENSATLAQMFGAGDEGASASRVLFQAAVAIESTVVSHTSGTKAAIGALDGIVGAAMGWYDDVERDDLIQAGASVVQL